jgi:hypothetical protein
VLGFLRKKTDAVLRAERLAAEVKATPERIRLLAAISFSHLAAQFVEKYRSIPAFWALTRSERSVYFEQLLAMADEGGVEGGSAAGVGRGQAARWMALYLNISNSGDREAVELAERTLAAISPSAGALSAALHAGTAAPAAVSPRRGTGSASASA